MATSELVAKLSFWQYWGGIAALFVGIGLVVEVLFVKFTIVIKSENRRKFWRHFIGEVGAFLVTVGVFAEWRCGQRITSLATDLQRITGDNISEALDKASKATTQASDANERAAIANEKAESERLSRVKLEEIVSWRKVTPEQYQELVRNLISIKEKVGGLHIDVKSANDPESISYAFDLIWIMKNSGLNVDPAQGLDLSLPDKSFPIQGVIVGGRKDSAESVAAAELIKKAFSTGGVMIGAGQLDASPKGPILVLVGSKPIPPREQDAVHWEIKAP